MAVHFIIYAAIFATPHLKAQNLNLCVFVCLSMFLFSMFACFYSRHILGFRICVMLSASQTSLLDSVLSQLYATLERQIAIFAFSKPFAHATF
ncbi:hypothetical protein [Helicobacter trogontum]|uniref:hypothetical protein n=1 Tax=Helicobacter trogontum TaxID=50960 RepID=UPI002A919B82|nr:hypothetical protein [Helicobacter trogontum]MDY5184767.1 hypothetical protein [Helicobacter trogontum]